MPRWLYAGTDVDDRYPCMCRPGRKKGCDPTWCECAGRPDAEHMPPACCSHRYGPAEAAQAQREYNARRQIASRDNG